MIDTVTIQAILTIKDGLTAQDGLIGQSTTHRLEGTERIKTHMPNVTNAWSRQFSFGTGGGSQNLAAVLGPNGQTTNYTGKYLYAAVIFALPTNTATAIIQPPSETTDPYTAIPNRTYAPGAWDILLPLGDNDPVGASNRVVYVVAGAAGTQKLDVIFLFGDAP